MKKFARRGLFGAGEDRHSGSNQHDDSSEYKDAYSNLSKSQLVQESKIFNDKQLNEKKCIDLLNKVIFLLNQGEVFAEVEKSGLFFNVTKLF
jgi:coatomer protein complex subunit gamma